MTETNSNSTPSLKTDRVSLRRRPDRGHYDLDAIAAVLDQTFLCHIGFAVNGQPFVIPTSFGRAGSRVYVHGSSVSRMLKELSKGIPLCLTAMILDGIVLARTAFNHSMNYRSAVILGTATPVEGPEKLAALELMAEHMMPGRWAETRCPNDIEMRATTVLAMDLNEASVKIRKGPPLDDEEFPRLLLLAGELSAADRVEALRHLPQTAELPRAETVLNERRRLVATTAELAELSAAGIDVDAVRAAGQDAPLKSFKAKDSYISSTARKI